MHVPGRSRSTTDFGKWQDPFRKTAFGMRSVAAIYLGLRFIDSAAIVLLVVASIEISCNLLRMTIFLRVGAKPASAFLRKPRDWTLLSLLSAFYSYRKYGGTFLPEAEDNKLEGKETEED